MKTKFDLVIAGGGLTAARAIKEYRAAGGGGRIALVTKEGTPPYHRPPLSKRYLRGEAERADTLSRRRSSTRTSSSCSKPRSPASIPTSGRSRPPRGAVTGTGSS